jgi:uncharacterized protein
MLQNTAQIDLDHWEKIFQRQIEKTDLGDDPAHDLAHFKRVVATAKALARQENGNLEVVLPAAWFHDLVNVPKNDPRRKIASRLSGEAAVSLLKEWEYPEMHWEPIRHAIEAHSFSAGIEPLTLEAKIVQDADRLDGLGAIGIARCFSVGGQLQRPLYHWEDPFVRKRSPDDLCYTVDHFYAKLFRVGETLRTEAGRAEGRRRVDTMKGFLAALEQELR